jgi:DNA-binding transcriptional regulator PaaX
MGRKKKTPQEKEEFLTKKILVLLSVGTFLSLAVLMPGIVPVFASLLGPWKKIGKKKLKKKIFELKKRKLVSFSETLDGQITINLTERGKAFALKYKIEEMKIQKPRKWDEKWRVVIFDIPEKKKKNRELFREKLKELGFHQLQKSVFIYPFPCREEIEFLRQNWGIAPFVLFLETDTIEEEGRLEEKFSL